MKVIGQKEQRSDVSEVERRLHEAPTEVPAPTDLHKRIMMAVRGRRAQASFLQPQPALRWLQWVAFASSAPCILLGLLLLPGKAARDITPSPMVSALSPAPEISAPTVALEFSSKLSQSLTASVSPLSEELSRVQQDLTRTANFLLATLP